MIDGNISHVNTRLCQSLDTNFTTSAQAMPIVDGMPPQPRHRFNPPRSSAATTLGWLSLGVAVVTSVIVVTNIRPAYLRFGLDRRQAMGWIVLYATTAAVSGWVALALLRWPRTVTVLLAVALVLQFLFVRWIQAHDGACVFSCGPFIS